MIKSILITIKNTIVLGAGEGATLPFSSPYSCIGIKFPIWGQQLCFSLNHSINITGKNISFQLENKVKIIMMSKLIMGNV